jgi:hypothetical protein
MYAMESRRLICIHPCGEMARTPGTDHFVSVSSTRKNARGPRKELRHGGRGRGKRHNGASTSPDPRRLSRSNCHSTAVSLDSRATPWEGTPLNVCLRGPWYLLLASGCVSGKGIIMPWPVP